MNGLDKALLFSYLFIKLKFQFVVFFYICLGTNDAIVLEEDKYLVKIY